MLNAKKFPEISNSQITYFGYRAEPFFASDLIASGLSDPKNIKKHFQLNNSIKIIQANYEFFNLQPSVDAFTNELANKIKISGQKYINGIIRECIKSGKNLLEISKKINKKVSKKQLTTKELCKLLEQYQKTAYDYCVYYIIAWFEKPERDLAQEIAKKYAKNTQQEAKLFSLICTPSEETSAEFEQDDFLSLLALPQKNKTRLGKIADLHAKKYGWLGVRYFIGKPWNKNDILNRICEADRQQAKKLLKDRVKNRIILEKKLNKQLNSFSATDKKLVSQIRDIIYLRTQRADFFHESSYYIQPLLFQIAEHLKINYEDLLLFSPDEVIKALQKKYNIHQHINPRKENLVIFFSGKGITTEGHAATAYIKNHQATQRLFKPSDFLKGNSAFKGKIRGQAKIVFSQKDLHKVRKGDILITTMTTPNYISAMEKAVGFVTDEGGILCHAAIVAREMKKPCIIGSEFRDLVHQLVD